MPVEKMKNARCAGVTDEKFRKNRLQDKRFSLTHKARENTMKVTIKKLLFERGRKATMHKRNSVFLRVLACFLSFVMMLTMVPLVSLTAAAEDSLPVLGELDEFSTKTSTAIKTLSNMMNAAANASKYSAMLKRAGGYAALLGGSIDALRGAIDAYDKEDPWYENLWNIGSGAVAGFLGLSESKSSATSVQYDLEGMKDLIVDLDKDVREINTKLDNLEETIQTNFEVLSKKIADKIQETEYKQFLNEFTQTGDRNAFSFYAFFKPDLDLRYRELLVALEGGNAQNIKQAYDNLYMVAKQSEQLYYFVKKRIFFKNKKSKN